MLQSRHIVVADFLDGSTRTLYQGSSSVDALAALEGAIKEATAESVVVFHHPTISLVRKPLQEKQVGEDRAKEGERLAAAAAELKKAVAQQKRDQAEKLQAEAKRLEAEAAAHESPAEGAQVPSPGSEPAEEAKGKKAKGKKAKPADGAGTAEPESSDETK